MKGKQFEFAGIKGWGGRRRGAGRKNLSRTVNHLARERVTPKFPMQITLKLRPGLPSLRRKKLLFHLASCLPIVQKKGLRIHHFTVMSDHIHLFAEADNNQCLAKGMQSLAIRLALRIKRSLAGTDLRGPIFRGRYHLRVLKSPRQTSNSLRYVLLNDSKHANLKAQAHVFSSGFLFPQWSRFKIRLSEKGIGQCKRFWAQWGELEKALSPPRSWLAREGWRRAA